MLDTKEGISIEEQIKAIDLAIGLYQSKYRYYEGNETVQAMYLRNINALLAAKETIKGISHD